MEDRSIVNTSDRQDCHTEASSRCLLHVPHIEQCPEWPTGCECVSTVMLLNYLGYGISVDDFISCVPKGSVAEENGILLGDDPNQCFIGSPYEEDSFGCYAGTIIRSLNRIMEENSLGLAAKDVSSLSTPELIEKYIRRGLPVIYWATIGMLPSFSADSWRLRGDGSVFTWTAQEHCLLLIGEDAEHYLFSDPWYPVDVKAYPKELTEMRHAEMHSMAVVIEKLPEPQGTKIYG